MENGIWLGVLSEAVTVIAGVILAGVSTLGGFYVKRLTDKMKMNTLKDDIATYVRGVEQSPSYKDFTGQEKFKLVFQKAMEDAIENNISISEGQLALLVESNVKTMKEAEGEALKKLIKSKIIEDMSEPDVEVIVEDKTEDIPNDVTRPVEVDVKG